MVPMTNENTVAIIPARGGSKGLPRKNLVEIGGKPLLTWTIESSLKSEFITKTVVSSEDEEILDLAKKNGAEVIERPMEFATDEASSESVVIHALRALESKGERFKYSILLQPTSPLRDAQDIDTAFLKLKNSGACSLISVYEIDNKILKAFRERSDGFIESVSDPAFPFMRRQALPRVLMSNGAIYIFETEAFLDQKCFFLESCVAFPMSLAKSVDIDSREDLDRVERMLQ